MRSPEMEDKYKKARENGELVPLSQEPQVPGAPDFHYWKIVSNRFPHDRHHTRHILIVLKRDCGVYQICLEELEELWYQVMPWAEDKFDCLKFNMRSLRSVNQTPHLHLLVIKDEYK